jgi:hypothetical protein
VFAVVFTGIAAFDGLNGSTGLQLPNEAPSKARAKVAETRLFRGRENGKRMSVGAKISAPFQTLSRPVFPVGGEISPGKQAPFRQNHIPEQKPRKTRKDTK